MFDKCADLLQRKIHEPFVYELFEMPAGSWRRLIDFSHEPATRLSSDIYVTWLVSPGDAPGFGLVLFYDGAKEIARTAEYNMNILSRNKR